MLPALHVKGISASIAIDPTLLQALHREQFVLVAKVSPQLPFDPAAPPAPVQGIPVVAETTLVLVSCSALGSGFLCHQLSAWLSVGPL